jgi:sigma-B regulation protein RsbU (phosphoserine phosphatase)
MLPQVAPAVPGYRLTLAYRPTFVVTGDYHDFFARPDGRVAAFVGDGSGHGPAAGMLMAVMRTILHTHDLHRDPGETLAAAGRLFHRQVPPDRFMTGIYLAVGPDGWVSWASAGHHPPILVARSGRVGIIDLTANGLMLGPEAAPEYATVRHRLQPGERMLVFTDGLYEARNRAGEPFGRPRVAQFLQYSMDDPLEDSVAALLKVVADHLQGAEFEDDFTILGIERAD